MKTKIFQAIVHFTLFYFISCYFVASNKSKMWYGKTHFVVHYNQIESCSSTVFFLFSILFTYHKSKTKKNSLSNQFVNKVHPHFFYSYKKRYWNESTGRCLNGHTYALGSNFWVGKNCSFVHKWRWFGCRTVCCFPGNQEKWTVSIFSCANSIYIWSLSFSSSSISRLQLRFWLFTSHNNFTH